MLTRTTTRIDGRPAFARARLRVVHGPDGGTEVEIPLAGLVVGSADISDVVLTDRTVSARHCSIKPSRGGFEVADLGSLNGVSYDGAAISKAVVPVGALLRIGTSLIQLVPAEEFTPVSPSERHDFGGLVGSSTLMRQVYSVLQRAAESEAPVLLMGESGTGKEICARAVHDHSARSGAPFVVFDCGAATESLIESDLFGHVRGAFTGADRDRTGAYERAHGGTLFLDEIGDLPLRLQPKLLRMLETGEVTPLGGKKSEVWDVRVVAATHHDLREEAGRGAFRLDVYYRLAVVEVLLPPLREHLVDIPEIVARFLEREGREPVVEDGENLKKLTAYGWPGNVRELRNVIARAIALSPPNTSFHALPIVLGRSVFHPPESTIRADRPFHDAKALVVDHFEREYLTDLLSRHPDNLALAARIAGVERKHLYRLLAKHGFARGGEPA